MKKSNWAGIALLIFSMLAGCGGGGSSTPAVSTPSLSGVAAVGSPIIGGAINVRCAAGSALAPVTTGGTGAWQIGISGQTLPCAVQVSGGTVNGAANATPYHSITTVAGTVNVTPLTDLLVANLAGTATPATWFGGLSGTPATLAAINQPQVDGALTKLRAALPQLAPLATTDPVTTVFTPAPGNPVDDMLAALQTALSNNGSSHTALLGYASVPSFTQPPSGLATALTGAYSGTTSGGASTAPATPPGVSAIASSASQINVNWVNVSGATGYNVYRSTAANVLTNPGSQINATPVTTKPYADSGRAASTAYYYKVTAVNGAGESAGSVEVMATTPAAGAATPTVTGFTPTSGAVGTTVTITGTNLGSFTPAPIVKFGTTVATPTYAGSSSITVAVPTGLAAGSYTITIAGATGTPVTVGNFTVTAAGGFVLTLTPHAVHPSFANSLSAAPLQVSYSKSVFCATTPGAAASDVTSAASATTNAGNGNGQQVERIGGTWSMSGLVGGIAVAYNTTYYCRGIAYSSTTPFATLAQTPEVSVTTIAPSLGLTWTKTRTNTAFDVGMSRLNWDGTQFIGVKGSTFASAADGITWQIKTIAAGIVFKQAIFAGGQYVAVGDSQAACVGYGCTPNPIVPIIYTSSDSTTWTARTPGLSNARLNDVAYSGTRYVVISSTGAVTTSTDGITWATGVTGVTTGLSRIVWTGTQFVAVGANGAVVTSTDGLAWTAISLNPLPASVSTQIALNNIAWTGTQFVVVGQTMQGAPKIFTSPDGATWTERVATGGSALSGIAWTGSQFVAVGFTWAASPGSAIMTSADGITWTPLTQFGTGVNGAGDLSALACSASKCVVNGMSGDWVSP